MDSGASGHYLDSDLLPDLDYILEDFEYIFTPVKIIGAGGVELEGTSTGIISVFAKDEDGNDRRVRLSAQWFQD